MADNITVENMQHMLCNEKLSMAERFRGIFALHNLGGKEAIDSLLTCLDNPSALLKHEAVFCIGQIQDPYAIPYLINVLENTSQEPIVRHEAATLPGAVDCFRFSDFSRHETPTMRESYTHTPYFCSIAVWYYSMCSVHTCFKETDSRPVQCRGGFQKRAISRKNHLACARIAETCELALARINWLNSNKHIQVENSYKSVDPAPASVDDNVESLKATLLNESLPLFDRYRAMFALRNKAGQKSVFALAE
ncbi:deoxyhypusine hydroxylase-like, partial [Saccoglossus kowalevskii]|uniref:Deoxyhypusine hydroxylase-like n=1 Tax=Saccoglossus kowalevskii TaxID=10224 RepID=A0ABM0N0P2_SACKO